MAHCLEAFIFDGERKTCSHKYVCKRQLRLSLHRTISRYGRCQTISQENLVVQLHGDLYEYEELLLVNLALAKPGIFLQNSRKSCILAPCTGLMYQLYVEHYIATE